MSLTARWGSILTAALLGAGLMSACGSSSATAAVNTNHGHHWVIALSNGYIGDEWRAEMENIAKTWSQHPPYNKEVTLKIYNAGQSASSQIAQIRDMISSHVNAIIVDANSPTALNPVIAEAHSAGIIVVSYDNNVTSPYAYNVNINQTQFGVKGAEWLVAQLHGKGNILMNNGVAGTTVSIDRQQGALSVFKKYPGIHIVDQINGGWNPAQSESLALPVLQSHPDINGIWSQGGTYGIVQAFLKLHRPWVPMAGEASNGFRSAMLKYASQGLKTFSIGDTPALGAVAMEEAVGLLEGHHYPHNSYIPAPIVTTTTAKWGATAFKNLPPSFYDDFQAGNVKVSAQAAEAGH